MTNLEPQAWQQRHLRRSCPVIPQSGAWIYRRGETGRQSAMLGNACTTPCLAFCGLSIAKRSHLWTHSAPQTLRSNRSSRPLQLRQSSTWSSPRSKRLFDAALIGNWRGGTYLCKRRFCLLIPSRHARQPVVSCRVPGTSESIACLVVGTAVLVPEIPWRHVTHARTASAHEACRFWDDA